MTRLDDYGRPEPPVAAGEVETLLGYLDWQRATLAWKCSGLDAARLRATTAASTMTLGGILKHMALVEFGWFSRSLHGREYAPPWDAVDWKADPDWEWHTAAEDSPEELFALWERAVEQSRADVAEVLDKGDGLGRLAKRTFSDGRSPSLRWILCHMIEEYARHNGHADLLRESIDGATGELSLDGRFPASTLGSVTAYYRGPGWVTRYFFNPQMTLMAKLGVSMNGSRTLAVKGRKSGQWRTTPVNLLVHDGRRYIVSPRGETQWARNLRVAGTGELRLGRRPGSFRARELGDDEKVPVLRAYLKRWRFETGIFFGGTGPKSSDDQIRAIASRHPVFEVLPVD